jgi:hypothetical protein
MTDLDVIRGLRLAPIAGYHTLNARAAAGGYARLLLICSLKHELVIFLCCVLAVSQIQHLLSVNGRLLKDGFRELRILCAFYTNLRKIMFWAWKGSLAQYVYSSRNRIPLLDDQCC